MADASGPARRVADRYRLDRLIGRGGSGAVWRGFDERLRRPVAVKEIAFSADVDEADLGRRRALREARAAARLGGAGVVGVYDIVDADGRAYLIMELVDAPNLNTLVRRAGPMTPQAVAELGLRVLDILETAHRAGIVHRDVKPSNVLIDGDEPRLTDFGIARLGDDATLTATGVVMGTPAYMAPEHARGGEMGPAVDIYGLGATMYYAVEGAPPFGSGGSLATVMAVLSDAPRAMERAGPLTQVLDELLDKDPAARPDAASLRTRLEAVAASSRAGDDAPADDGPPDAVAAAATAGAQDGDDDGPAAAQATDDPVGAVGSPSDPSPPTADSTLRGDPSADGTAPPDGRVTTARDTGTAGPTGGPSTAAGAPARGRRWVTAGIAVAVLLLSAFALSRANDGQDAGGGPADASEPSGSVGAERGPGATPSAAANDDASGAAASQSAPPPVSEPPSPSGPADGVLPAYDVEVPDDWVVRELRGQPYRVAHPPGWQIVRRGATLTDVRDPQTGMYLRLDWVAERRDPVTAWEQQEASFATRHDGYEQLQLRRTTYRGDRAALWEYRYRDGGAALHAYNLGVNRGANGFALNLQARQSDFGEARRLWPYFLASYRFDG